MKQNSSIQMITDYEGDMPNLDVQVDGEIPIFVTRNLVMFPGILSPILVGRKPTLALVEHLEENPNTIIAIVSQKDSNINDPQVDDVYMTGIYARFVRAFDMPGNYEGNNRTVILQGLGKCKIKDITTTEPYMKGYTVAIPEEAEPKRDKEFSTAVEDMKMVTKEYIHGSDDIPDDTQFALDNINNPVVAVNYVCSTMPFPVTDKIQMLEENSIKDRLFALMKVLNREIQFQHLRQDIRSKTREDLDEQQREYFLHQQIKNIKEELGDGDSAPDKKELLEKAKNKKWSEDIAKIFQKELDKLDTLNPQSPDYSVQVNYLQTMVNLPWNEYTKDDLDLKRAKRILDKDHYGMEKVKERILEYIAVLQLRGNLKSPILCLYGPPGVGKTSLGKSIAEAMKRKYVRVSLGGLHDESEIRGHRKTYIGAMPGRIIKNIQKAGSSNPVFILDEIDKVTQNTVNGDPSSALLEVLDPEQNNAFHDNYLDMDYDLSKVLFIATANDLNTIPRPLLDRMELIEVSGYITEEKVEIAKRHLVPKELENTGLDQLEEKPKFAKATLEKIIESYTRESGVRQLEKQINKAMRKLAFKQAMDKQLPYTKITPDKLEDLLGKPPFTRDIYQGNKYAGVVTGLAWTSVGGEILFIETSLSKGKAGKLTLTGNLGDVMKESAVIALEYVKAHISALNVDYRIFEQWNIHIHVPEGATPKDGPSAGITIATSIASALTQCKVRKNTAMTGEITLRGKVLPVGGIKEKILAAKRAGITDIVMCSENKKDVEEIPEVYRKGLQFHFVENIQQVWDFALTDEKVEHPVDFTIVEEKKEETK
ncbi:endopeptidase La [Prevotella melaninogenica]|jgi:endopeptidase La|uniref:Lon protease n=1 Tax=Prevotella melaninogenica TaxID=28132 RepID=A0A7D4KDE3_9BACT|nr:endopeptidase La [Prevotella melaninogenica]EFC72583.1 endopeptidase La [Prevotella melaninogenica D18]QKH88736.1 endopeptidase La [Prevotella melaninogenica]